MQAAIVVRRPPVCPVGPIVSITESPQGEKVPVAPISTLATSPSPSNSTGVRRHDAVSETLTFGPIGCNGGDRDHFQVVGEGFRGVTDRLV